MDSLKSRLVLLCGLPASGKTTLARMLTEEMPAVRFCPDEWMIDLGIDPFNDEARDKLEKRLWQLSQELLKQGQNIVLEFGFWSRTEREEKRLKARELGVAVELLYLDLSFDELWQRLDARNRQHTKYNVTISRKQLEHWVTMLEAPDEAEFQLFDAGSGVYS